MKKRHITLFTAIAAAAAFASSAQAAVITAPTDGYTGDYRLAIVTTANYSPTQTLAALDGNVLTSITLIPELVALGTTWQVLGSSPTVDARDHTGTNPGVGAGVPIYTTDGTRVALNNSLLWGETTTTSTAHDNPIDFDDGTDVEVWGAAQGANGNLRAIKTGTNADGTKASSAFGSTNTVHSRSINRLGTTWISDGSDDSSSRKIYGISGVIQGIPEPSSMSLLALGGLALLRRRRA